MNKKTTAVCISIVIALQVVLLAWEYLGAVYPLWTGREISLKVVPVDPRSLFRGNYARLRYQISSIDLKDWDERRKPRNGEIVYVKLKAGPDGVFLFDGAYPEKPADGLFIRGRLDNLRLYEQRSDVRYGVEAFFAPKDKAIALENDLQHGGIAIIMVAGNGKATLKDVIPSEER